MLCCYQECPHQSGVVSLCPDLMSSLSHSICIFFRMHPQQNQETPSRSMPDMVWKEDQLVPDHINILPESPTAKPKLLSDKATSFKLELIEELNNSQGVPLIVKPESPTCIVVMSKPDIAFVFIHIEVLLILVTPSVITTMYLVLLRGLA